MTGSNSPAARAVPWLVVTGVLVAALSLRGPLVAPTPVLRDIEHDLQIGAAAAGFIPTVPVLMFAALTPVAALLIRRAGGEIALAVSLAGVLVGTFIRAIPGYPWMIAGMVVIGAAIAIGNVVIPVIIRRDVPPERVGMVTAAYAATLNVGSLITALGTAPLAEVMGWPLALVAWSVLTLAGVLLWSAHMARVRGGGRSAGDRFSGTAATSGRAVDLDPRMMTGPVPVLSSRPVWRIPMAWILLCTFGTQTTIYYGLTAWLPTITADELGLDRAGAGALTSIVHGVGVVGAFVVPLITRAAGPIWAALAIAVSWLALTGGMLFAPEYLALWLTFGGIAHAGGFVVIFSSLVVVARDDAEAAGMSAFVQGGGYVLAASAGPLMGVVHESAGGWDLPLAAMLVLSVLYGALILTVTVGTHRRR